MTFTTNPHNLAVDNALLTLNPGEVTLVPRAAHTLADALVALLLLTRNLGVGAFSAKPAATIRATHFIRTIGGAVLRVALVVNALFINRAGATCPAARVVSAGFALAFGFTALAAVADSIPPARLEGTPTTAMGKTRREPVSNAYRCIWFARS